MFVPERMSVPVFAAAAHGQIIDFAQGGAAGVGHGCRHSWPCLPRMTSISPFSLDTISSQVSSQESPSNEYPAVAVPDRKLPLISKVPPEQTLDRSQWH